MKRIHGVLRHFQNLVCLFKCFNLNYLCVANNDNFNASQNIKYTNMYGYFGHICPK